MDSYRSNDFRWMGSQSSEHRSILNPWVDGEDMDDGMVGDAEGGVKNRDNREDDVVDGYDREDGDDRDDQGEVDIRDDQESGGTAKEHFIMDKVLKDISLSYTIFIMVIAILYNFTWASLTTTNDKVVYHIL